MLDTSEISTVRRPLKVIAALLLGPYRFNRIYRLGVTDIEPEIPQGITVGRLGELPSAAVRSVELRDRFCYSGDDAYGYGLFLDGCLAAICWFWGPQRFEDPLLWRLAGDEAILVDLVTASNHRGRGLAPLLIRYASADMRRTGWNSLYTWMWHSHHASYHAFERAGWEQIAWVLEIRPLGVPWPLRVCWRPLRRRALQQLA
jgi:GNAT superfamily N-acetyltransferase